MATFYKLELSSDTGPNDVPPAAARIFTIPTRGGGGIPIGHVAISGIVRAASQARVSGTYTARLWYSLKGSGVWTALDVATTDIAVTQTISTFISPPSGETEVDGFLQITNVVSPTGATMEFTVIPLETRAIGNPSVDGLPKIVPAPVLQWRTTTSIAVTDAAPSALFPATPTPVESFVLIAADRANTVAVEIGSDSFAIGDGIELAAGDPPIRWPVKDASSIWAGTTAPGQKLRVAIF